MAWDKLRDFGVLKQDGPRRLKLHYTNRDYNLLTTDNDIKDYRWSGDHVVITFTNNKVRRYSSLLSYNNIV